MVFDITKNITIDRHICRFNSRDIAYLFESVTCRIVLWLFWFCKWIEHYVTVLVKCIFKEVKVSEFYQHI